jgi:hypothetical protein
VRSPRFAAFSEAGILFLLLAVTAAAYALHWSFTIDDAAISFSYARNFAQGFGLGALYPGAARVAGYSNLLWVIALAMGTRLGIETLVVSKILGLIFSLGTVFILYFTLRPFLRYKWLLLGLALLPLSLTFSFWAASGLENSLYAFLILLSVYFLLQEESAENASRARLPVGSALSLVLVGMTRPDGLVYALAGLGFKLLALVLRIAGKQTERKALRLNSIRLLAWLGMFGIGYGLFRAWHYWYFAAWWPNPIYAKAGWYGTDLARVWFEPNGWVYLRSYFRSFAAVGILPALLLGSLVSLRGPERIFPIFALAALALPLYTPDWMLNFRFVFPFIPFEVALLALAADQILAWLEKIRPLLLRLRRNKQNTRPMAAGLQPLKPGEVSLALLAAGLAIWFGVGTARFAWANLRLTQRQLACGYQPLAETRCLDGRMYWTIDEVNQQYAELSKFAAQLGLEDPLYMIPDIGATSYVQNKRILDLAGLGDYQIARIREEALLKIYIFEEQRPDFILTHGAWTRRSNLTAYQAFWENYLPVELGGQAVKAQAGNSAQPVDGTFVRRDRVIVPLDQVLPGEDTLLAELAPGFTLVAVQNQANGLDIFWQMDPLAEQVGYQSTRLEETGGEMVFETIDMIGYGWLTGSAWSDGEVIRQHLALPANLPPGKYELQIRLVNDQGQAINNQVYQHIFTQADGDSNAGQPGPKPVERELARLLVEAQAALEAGDNARVLETVQSAAVTRLRTPVNPAWRQFSRTLQSAGGIAELSSNWQQAYPLYQAAALADPNNAWAQHDLENARKAMLVGES